MINSETTPAFSGDFLPVASREARVASRKWFSYLVRSVIAGLFALVAFRRLSAPMWDSAGPPLLKTLGTMGYFYAIVGGAFKTFDALSHEKREGTLGLLLLTDLKPFQILCGKMLAASALTFFGLLAFLPILSMPMLVGGVTFDQVLRLGFSLVTALLLSMSWGLYISAATRNYLSALTGAATLAAIFAFLPLPVAARLNPHLHTFPFETLVCLFSPALPFELAFTVNPQLIQFFWPSIFCNLALALTWFSAAVLVLPGRCHEAPGQSKLIETLRAKYYQFRFGAPAQRAKTRQRLLETNPLFWLANRDRVSSPGLTSLCLAVLIISQFFNVAQLGLLIASLAILYRMAHASSHSISEDQKNGALELLLSSTLSVREILSGLNRAMLRRFILPVALVILWPWLVPDFGSNHLFKTLLVCSSILLLATWLTLSWVGPWFALRKKPAAAAWTSLAVVALPPWLIWLASIFPGLFDPLYTDLQPIGAVVCCFVGLLHCALVTRWARQILSANFREAAADPFATIQFEPALQALLSTVGLTVVPIGKGRVQVARWGKTARLFAIPAENQIFVAWGGHVRGNENPLHIDLQGNAYVTARFTNAPTRYPAQVLLGER
jgi:ABC-type transport system involved in multi-copper enzyme maturation permease subunit